MSRREAGWRSRRQLGGFVRFFFGLIVLLTVFALSAMWAADRLG